MVFALALATTVTLFGGNGWDWDSLDNPRPWLAGATSGVLYYGLGFTFYLADLRHIQASYAGAFLTLIPVFGLSASYLTGERLDPRQWLGAIVILIATAAIALEQRS